MMKPSCHTVLLVVIFFWFQNLHFITSSFSSTVNSPSAHLCSYNQSHALLDFNNNFIINSYASYTCSSSSHPRTNSWHEGQDCCYWDGVTCNTTSGEVIGLDLSCSWLQGKLFSNNSLFLLQHLQILNLAYNNFIGSEIPPQLSQFQRLTHLNLSKSYFSGEVPIDISYLSNLVSLDLSSDFGFLTLKRLAMKNIVQNLTMLKELNLHGVDSSLVEPDSLRNISSSLTSLVLYRLNGIFPTSIFQLPNLQLLRLYGHFNGDLQVSLPTSNWSTTSLTELQLIQVNLKNGLPSSIGSLKSLKYLYIGYCGNNGSIPDSIGNLTMLVHLSLPENYLVGKIPSSLAYLTNLEYLELTVNELVGSIPNFSNSSTLNTIDLSYNWLTETIPFSLYSIPLLRKLDLSHNLFTGGQVHPFRSPVVQEIHIHGCTLQGIIPTELFPHGANQLVELDFHNNSLNGTVPSSLFIAPSLLQLDLSYNKFEGNIPSSIFRLRLVWTIDFSNNQFEGEIPRFIVTIISLQNLNLSHNNLRGHIPLSMGNLINLAALDLSSNKFTGTIPEELATITSLQVLNLSNNALDGQIPRGGQFDTFDNSSYQGNLALCGPPLPSTCSNKNNETSPSLPHEQDDSSEDFDKKIILYGHIPGLVIGLFIGYIVFSGELPIWFVKMIQRYKLRTLNRRIQQPRGRN